MSKYCLDATELDSVYSNRLMELRAAKLWGEKAPLFFQVPLPLNWVLCGPVESPVIRTSLPPTTSSALHVAKFRRAINIHFVLTSGSFCLFYFSSKTQSAGTNPPGISKGPGGKWVGREVSLCVIGYL